MRLNTNSDFEADFDESHPNNISDENIEMNFNFSGIPAPNWVSFSSITFYEIIN